MLSKTLLKTTLLAGLFSPSNGAVIARDVSKADVRAAYDALQQWYNSSIGIWIPSTGWWNSANCLTVLIGLAAVDGSMKQTITGVISETYTNAPLYNAAMKKMAVAGDDPSLMETYYTDQWPYLPQSYIQQFGNPEPHTCKNFLNDYYDDEGWWALGWIAAYDLTKEDRYLHQAEIIFKDMHSVFGKVNCSSNSGGVGGIWWDKQNTYVNAIANELFFSTAASLANRATTPDGRQSYLSIASQQWAWFKGTGMITDSFTINDGLDQQTCQNNGGTVWSYNQGVVLGGLVEFSKATGDSSYIDTAHRIAGAAIATLAPGGILTDPCEPDCGADGSQFKGIFVRNLLILHKASPKDEYRSFFKQNAKSIWENDRNERNESSVRWTGPWVTPANASTQSSAMDCLVAAVA